MANYRIRKVKDGWELRSLSHIPGRYNHEETFQTKEAAEHEMAELNRLLAAERSDYRKYKGLL